MTYLQINHWAATSLKIRWRNKMKTTIQITGQIGGNHRLLSAILSAYLATSYGDGMFYSKHVEFQTRKDAFKALSVAWHKLIADEPEFKHGISYSPKWMLHYDASKASISERHR
jgi:hypothetical protein